MTELVTHSGVAEVGPDDGSTVASPRGPIGAVRTVLSDGQTEPASTVVPLRRGPGKPPGYPKPAGSGRAKGQPNKKTLHGRQLIEERGKPFKLLSDISAGRKVKVASAADPTKAEFIFPSLGDRIKAAAALGAKLLADLKSQELTGKDGSPLHPAPRARVDIVGLLRACAAQNGRVLPENTAQLLDAALEGSDE
jgi:hypothetical protein